MKLVLCLSETQVSIYNLTEGIKGVTECASRVFLSAASRQHIDEVLACSMATEGKGKQANLAMNIVAGNLYSIYKKRVDV